MVSVGIGLPMAGPQDYEQHATYVAEAEKLGVEYCWVAESWGYDAVSPLAFLAGRTKKIHLGTGIMQISARTPAMTAMTAMTMQAISGGRFIIGLGASGPQVVEGWHGQQFGRSMTRLREYTEIVRMAMRGERVHYEGSLYRLPLPGGEGKALKTSATPVEAPVYFATLSPKSLEMTGEIGDGWLGTSFMPEHADVFFKHIEAGAQKAGRSLKDLHLQAGGTVAFGDDVEKLINDRKPGVAFQLGAMGSKQHNFYNEAFQRAGYEDLGREVQMTWLGGDRRKATELIPDEMVERTNFLGTDGHVKDRIRAYKACGITCIRVDPVGEGLAGRLDTLGKFVELVKEVDAE